MHPTPGAEHERLSPMVGSWDVQISFWLKPEEPPLKSRGFSIIEPLFGGLFLQERVEGLIGEQAFVSLSWYGFSPQKKRYESTRIASTRADRVDESGAWDERQGALVLESAAEASGARTRTVLRLATADSLVVERFTLPAAGEPWRTSEIRYTRRRP